MITKITHLTLFVTNQDEALSFYQQLGFKVHTDAHFGDIRWLTLHPSEQPHFELVLMLAATDDEKALVGKQGGSHPLICLESNNCQQDYEQLKAADIEFMGVPETQPWGIAVLCKDLYGNMIYICQPQ